MRIWLSRLLAAGLIVGGSLAVSSVSKGGSFRLTWTDEATVADIRAALAAHEITCRQLVQMYLDRIEAYNKKGPLLNAIVMVNPNALATADALDRGHTLAFEVRTGVRATLRWRGQSRANSSRK